MDMKIEEVSLENAVHKLFDASSKMISLPSVYQDFPPVDLYLISKKSIWKFRTGFLLPV